MRFRNDDFPAKNGLTDTIAEEHPKRFVAVAEEQIRAMHSHEDGSSVELHQVGSREFIQQSIQTSLEGKLGGSSDWQPQQNPQNNLAAAKIEYEKTHFDSSRRGPVAAAMRESSQSQPQHDLFGKGQSKTELYGAQQSVTGAGAARHETAMVGCNCGAEWTVTGQSTKAQGAGGVKVEQYGNGGTAQPGGYRASGAGGEKQEYRTSAGQQQDYKG